MALLEHLQQTLPLSLERLTLTEKTGLVIIDEVVGFAMSGGGNLAPTEESPQINRMVRETDRLARSFSALGWPMLAFMDCHKPGKAEPPYPAHCEAGSGEEKLIPELAWLGQEKMATLVSKDCINGFIGAIDGEGRNHFLEWLEHHRLNQIVVVGICTDICVMDFVLTLLSVRNHDLTKTLKDIYVYEPACATFDLPMARVLELNLPKTASHPQDITHHMGLYFMAARGATLVAELELPK